METGIKIGIDGTGAQAGARVVTRSLDDIIASATKALNPIKALEEAAKLAAGAFAGFQLVDFIRNTTNAAAAAESMSVVLRKVAENVGYTSDQIDSLAESVAKMGMTNEGARQTLTKMIQTNIDLSNATKLTTIAQNAAVIAHTSTSEALDMMNMSISTGMERTLKHMGIIVDFSKAEKDYAQAIGKSVSLMTEKEKTQARVNDVIRASSQINGAFTASLSTAEGIMRQLAVATDETKDEFGKLFLPTYKAILTDLLTAMKDIQSWFEHNKGTVAEWSSSLLQGFYATEAEVLRLAMLLDKAGMSLYAFGNAIGNENSMKHYNEFQQRYIENEKRIIELAKKANAVGISMTGSGGNEAAAAAGGAADKLRELADKSSKATDEANKLWPAVMKQREELAKLSGTNEEATQAQINANQATEEYKRIMQDAASGNYAAKELKDLIDKSDALKLLKSRYDDLHANDELRNTVTNLENPGDAAMNQIKQDHDTKMSLAQLEYDAVMKNYKGTEDQEKHLASIKEKMALIERESNAKTNLERMKEASQYASSMGSAFTAIGDLMSQGNKRSFEEGKKLRETGIAMSTAAAVINAYTTPGTNWITATATAVAAAAVGAAQLQKVRNEQYTGMATGGFVSGGTPGQDSVPALLMPGEVVINRQAVDYYGLGNVIDINEFRKRKFGLGGLVPHLPGDHQVSQAFSQSDPFNTLSPVTDSFRTTGDVIGEVTGYNRSQRNKENAMNLRIAEVNAFNEAFKKFGSEMTNFTGISEDAKVNLVAFSGGVDAFNEKTANFIDKFLTDSEKTAMQGAAAQSELDKTAKDLNISIPKTRDGFKDLVESLNLTTVAGQKEYAALMNVANSADAVYKAAEDAAQKLKDLASSTTSRMMRALGDTSGADLYDLKIKQQQELADAQSKGYDTTELLKVQTLEWANAVKTAAQTVSDAQKKIIDSANEVFKKSVDIQKSILSTLKEIMTGPLSGLSPEAAYRQAQSQFENADAASLPEAARALLEASKNYNASGMGYQTDLQNVITALGNASGISTPSLETVSAQQSVVGNAQSEFDKYVSDYNAAAAEWDATKKGKSMGLQGLMSAARYGSYSDSHPFNPPALAGGGLASGWSMVGERGPELVNFSNPGRVYTAEQTKSALSGDNSETISELREQNRLLRAAIAILQAGFSGTIEAGSKQAASLNAIASTARREAAA